MATTDRPSAELASCVEALFDGMGRADIVPTEFGQRVDYRFKNLGGSVKEPTVSVEVHDGERRTILMYGFGTWRRAIRQVWEDASKKCFPELLATEMIKPKK